MPVRPRVGTVGLAGMSVFLHVNHFHAPGETLHADGIHTEFGGKAYNQAVAASRMGVETTFFGAVGNDENGRQCRAALLQEGIQPCLQILYHTDTAYASILTDAQGENRVTVFPGAAAQLSAEFIYTQEAAIAACSCLLLGLECPWPATMAALEIAERYHIYTILNPAPAEKLPSALLRRFDLLTPNAQEAALLLGIPHPASISTLCKELKNAQFPTTAVTVGSQGALLWDKEKANLLEAIPAKAIDTTGAGDCFNGVLAAALCRGQGLQDAMALAVCAASKSVEKAYVMPALPFYEDLCLLPPVIHRLV